jgi:hypothetical protein
MSRENRPIKTALALALVAGAIAPAATSARELEAQSSGPATSAQDPVQIIRVTQHGGFDWSDAGIGAAGGLGLSLLAIGGGGVLTQRRGRGSRGPTATTS